MEQSKLYADEIEKINAEIAKDPNNLTLLERRRDLLQGQRDLIESAEDEKQAIKDLIEEGYNSFLDKMQEVIDKRKEAMQQVKDLRGNFNSFIAQKHLQSAQKPVSHTNIIFAHLQFCR